MFGGLSLPLSILDPGVELAGQKIPLGWRGVLVVQGLTHG
jgi:hypothetical protein